jgi:catechol 2,3-dioxygenase-like lactoylglutathione lyase family enzyme
MGNHICGIQQIGIGTPELQQDWDWYKDVFGMDIRIFQEAAEAPLMTRYTGGTVQKRNAVLATNMQGGGGFEVWQYESRQSMPPAFQPQLGDLGIIAAKMKTPNADVAHKALMDKGVKMLTEVVANGAGQRHFTVSDPKGNWFQVIESADWFKDEGRPTCGVYGAVIGVSHMDRSLAFYRDLLGFDTVLSDERGLQPDLAGLPGGNLAMRRTILAQSKQGIGPFTPLLGHNQLELVQLENGQGRKLFENRYWGDMGFIHLCFDVVDMTLLKEQGKSLGYPFTVDSLDGFEMGKASGRFCYAEDPDGTLIEFVETHRLPIVEKWGWYMNIQKRKPGKSLPNWLLNSFRFNRVK